MGANALRPVRIGAVSYLNSKPLIEGLEELATDAELILDFPSRLADDLADGALDIGLIPSVELLRHPEYEIISDACVATHGPVMSVKLYFRTHPGQVRTLALDEGSRTSAVLAQIMLAERYGDRPKLERLPLGCSLETTTADAVLMIGDRAMHDFSEEFAATWDLGEEWTGWTGLPFVFALWAGRSGTGHDTLDEALCRARDLGLERAREIAEREAEVLGIDRQTAYEYLTQNLYFRLGSAERNGLKLFRDLATRLGLIRQGVDLVFRDCAPAQ